MPVDDLIHIQLKKIIHAKKWKVVRQLTKVWEFPSYVPCVREAVVIKKERNKIRTRWCIQIDKFPITWEEEETLSLRQNSIFFEAVGGDLDKFKGEWIFRKHAEGTEVTVNLYLKLDIPVIRIFSEAHIKDLITRNFEAILESLENQMVSKRYAAYRHGDKDKISGFAILGHFYNFNHLVRCLKMLNPNFHVPSQEFLSSLFTMTPSFKMYDMKEFLSKTGTKTHGCFIVCTFVPEMLDKDVHAVYSKVVRACKLAEKQGIGIVALGGFTSMVGEKLGHQISEEVDVPITTGNTYTAALAVDGVSEAARLLGLDLGSLKVTIIGGTGDIGSACARVLSEQVKQVTITGRTKSNLRRLEGELKRKHKAKIEATTNNEKAVRNADIIIAAANSSAAILDINWFKPGAIICDLGYPKNISYASIVRRDIFIFSGGLASVPTPIEIGIDIGLSSPNVSYGCFSEAIILSLERRYENFSSRRGNITKEKMDEIRHLGKKHGFELAPFFWADRLISEEDIEQIKRAVIL